MTNPERQHLLPTFNAQNHSVEMCIRSPSKFSFSALREIVRFQIFNSVSGREIAIKLPEGELLITQNELRGYRHLFGQERKQKVDSIAEKMLHAEEVVIRDIPVVSGLHKAA